MQKPYLLDNENSWVRAPVPHQHLVYAALTCNHITFSFQISHATAGLALHQDVADGVLATIASGAGPKGHQRFIVGLVDDFGSGSVALKRATIRTVL